ncbi:MAG: hypothetical protein Q8P34_09065 [Bacteroidota bacterium]|nr:hypothetical protein [Bacteroidota bacterium]
MIKPITISIFLTLMVLSAYSKVWTLSDSKLEVRFDDQTALFSVTDKRCNKVWEQLPLKDQCTVKKTEQNGNSLNMKLSGKHELDVTFVLTANSALEISLNADDKISIQNFAFPSAFKAPDNNHYVLLTDSEGLLLSVDDTEYPVGGNQPYFCGGGLAMAWMGMVDNQFNTGYMAILNTPYDATMRTKRENGLVAFEPLWLPSIEKFGYERKVTYHFFDKGGYVAQEKAYRDYIWKKNNVISLKEKGKRFPAMDKMMGTVHIYVWDKARCGIRQRTEIVGYRQGAHSLGRQPHAVSRNLVEKRFVQHAVRLGPALEFKPRTLGRIRIHVHRQLQKGLSVVAANCLR